MQVLIEDS